MRRAAVFGVALLLGCPLLACTERNVVAPAVRVCGERNNMPFSNDRAEGADDRIASLLAADLGMQVAWKRLTLVDRDTVEAEQCDVVLGLPPALGMLPSTRPYYRASWVFVTRAGVAPVHSFDDPRLRTLRIGVPTVGHGAPLPPGSALARRNIRDNVRSYPIMPDDPEDPPQFAPLRGLASGDLDVAVVWGPHAGFFVHEPSMTIAAVEQETDDGVPLATDIAIGVRDVTLLARIDDALVRHEPEIDNILRSYGILR